MSSTVAKALSLLNQFTEAEPEIGLSELARRTGVNKASVHRMLAVLADAGLVEQADETRAYSLGAGILRLAQIREAAFPVTSVLKQALDALAEVTGETAHAALVSGSSLATICLSESQRSSRVSLVAGEVLPLHSTASGLAVLAFGAPALLRKTLSAGLPPKTRFTLVAPEDLEDRVATTRRQGYAVVDQGNEEDVYGIAVPFFDRSGCARGAVGVATPCHRMTPELQARIVAGLAKAEATVTFKTGGRSPGAYRAAIAASLAALPGGGGRARD